MLVRKLLIAVCLPAVIAAMGFVAAMAQSPVGAAPQAAVKTIEITPTNPDLSVGQKLKFTAVAKDASGNPLNEKPSVWFAVPFDLAKAGEDGTVSFFAPGEVMLGAIVGGKPGFIKVMVKPASIARIDIEPLKTAL
ncbi:MAG TPA: hypothetical protein VGJ55_10610, partial [Pyrinomonadaceae bacterium]